MNTKFCCRACESTSGLLVLDLGTQPLANNLLAPTDLGKVEPKFPLRLAVCTRCWLIQITDIIPPVALFAEYLYFSSFSDTLLRHAQDAAHRYVKEFALSADSFVVEIASNDGYLLKNFKAAGIPCLGIEPAANIAQVAREKGIDTISKFFGAETAKEVATTRGKADLILGNNVFAHVPAINDFVSGLAHLLKPDGTIILEFPYAADLIEHAEFDTIYHEHVFYFTLTALMPLFDRHQLSIFHIERLPIHGGSLRLFLGHKSRRKSQTSVTQLLDDEHGKGISSVGYYRGFADSVAKLRNDLCELLHCLKSEGRSIAAYGASAKGSTLLNFYGLDCNTLDFVADRSTYKQGRLTPGTHIPIVAPDQLLARQPDYTLLLTWNFADEILMQQQSYRDRGGRFIIPIPTVRIA